MMPDLELSQWLFCAAQLTLLSGVVYVVGRILLKRRPEITSIVSAISILTGCALVMVTVFGVPRPWSIPHARSAGLSQPVSSQIESTAPSVAESTNDLLSSSPSGPGISAEALTGFLDSILKSPTRPLRQSGKAVLVVFLGLAVVQLVRLLLGTLGLLHLRIHSPILESPAVECRLKTLANQMQFQQLLQVRVCQSLGSPCVSWLSPRTIFVPSGFETWTDDEQDASLAHELGHLKRCDAFWRTTSLIAWTFNCWHPLMWLVRGQLTLSQELSADRLAASALGRSYRTGLSQLALRLDRQVRSPNRSVYFLSTSVSSSSLIRRIKMLKGFSKQAPIVSWPQQVLATGICLACCLWLCCWTVEAQTVKASNQDHPRVAENTLPKTSARQPFTRPTHSPWNKLSQSHGYVSVRVSDILEHPAYAPFLPGMWETLGLLKENSDGKRPSFSELGLPVSIVSRIDTTLSIQIRDLTEAERGDSGLTKSGALGLGLGGLEVTTSKEVDWPALTKALDLSSFTSAKTADAFATKLSETAVPGRQLFVPSITFLSDSIEPKPASSPAQLSRGIQKEMWDHVSGGIVTAVLDTSATIPHKKDIESEGSVLVRELAETDKRIRGVGLGIDVSGAPDAELVRMAFEPVQGVSADQLAKRVQRVFELVADQCEEDGEARLAEGIRQTVVDVQETGEGSFVLAKGNMSIGTLLMRLIKISEM